MTPEQHTGNIAKLVSAARALLSGQVGISVGALRINNLLRWLGAEVDGEFPQFRDFLSQVPASVPLANERLHWETDALLTADRQLAEIESKARVQLMSACAQIIRTYG